MTVRREIKLKRRRMMRAPFESRNNVLLCWFLVGIWIGLVVFL